MADSFVPRSARWTERGKATRLTSKPHKGDHRGRNDFASTPGMQIHEDGKTKAQAVERA